MTGINDPQSIIQHCFLDWLLGLESLFRVCFLIRFVVRDYFLGGDFFSHSNKRDLYGNGWSQDCLGYLDVLIEIQRPFISHLDFVSFYRVPVEF